MVDLYRKATDAYKGKDFETALNDYKQALAIQDPKVKPLYYAESNAMLGAIYEYYRQEPGHLEKALKYYMEALKIDSANFIANKHLKPLEVKIKKAQEQAPVSMVKAEATTPMAQSSSLSSPTVRLAGNTTVRQAVRNAVPSPKSNSNINSGLSIGVGYPYFSLKYYFDQDFGTEFRFAFGDGINVFAGRGYWSFEKISDFSLFTGLEAGYITFNTMNSDNTMRVNGTGYEFSPFVGAEYFLDKKISFMIDFGMPVIGVTSRDISLGGIEWVTNGALYFYPF